MDQAVEIGKRIKKRRKELRLTQKELAKMIGVSSTSVVYWERGENAPSAKYLKILEQALKTSMSWIVAGALAEAGSFKDSQNVQRAMRRYNDVRKSVPLISWVAAGSWTEASDPYEAGDADEWFLCPSRHSASSYALTVKGDSMTSPAGRSYPEGMIIFVDPEKQANNGDRVIAKIKGEDAVTFKQLVIDGGRYYLKPLNPAYPLITDPFKVIGKVIGAYMEE